MASILCRAGILGMIAIASSPAAAVMTRYQGNFSISGITGFVTGFSGTFDFTLDPLTVPYVNDVTPDSFSANIDGFTYSPVETRVDYYPCCTDSGFLFGAAAGGTDINNTTPTSNPRDFRIRFILDGNLGLVSARGQYVLTSNRSPRVASFDTSLGTGSASWSVTATPISVPEPGVWAMFVAGFGAMGAALRRRGRPEMQRSTLG